LAPDRASQLQWVNIAVDNNYPLVN
jgi:hypothetical protein